MPQEFDFVTSSKMLLMLLVLLRIIDFLYMWRISPLKKDCFTTKKIRKRQKLTRYQRLAGRFRGR